MREVMRVNWPALCESVMERLHQETGLIPKHLEPLEMRVVEGIPFMLIDAYIGGGRQRVLWELSQRGRQTPPRMLGL